jgi:hypothetical protein
MEIFAAFRSRTEALTFSTLLASYNVPSVIVNTPRRISISCGISVKFLAKYQHIAIELLSRRTFDTFVGFFS